MLSKPFPILMLLMAAVLLGRMPAAIQAAPNATFVVTTLDDTDDGTCTAGHCSLREAINASNAQAGADTILFVPSTNGVLHLGTSLPIITELVTIEGPGSGYLIINGSAAPTNSILRVNTGGLTLSGMTLAQGGSMTVNVGGAILSTPFITITDVRFTNNMAKYGGALALYGGGTLTNVEFGGNQALQNDGGAIVAYNGTLTIQNGQFFNNSSAFNGGALLAQTNFLNIYDSYFYNNSASATGGAIAAVTTADIQRTLFVDNHAVGNGGAIYLQVGNAHNTLHNLLFQNNIADTNGNALVFGGGPAAIVYDFAHSTIVASPQAAGTGVYMSATGAILNVTNTIIANQATGLAKNLGTVNEDYNLFYDNGMDRMGVFAGANSLNSDPRFVSAADDLYDLLPDSPAVDAGVASAVGLDIYNHPRPQGGAPDMGAYELAQATVVGTGYYDVSPAGVAITVTQTGDLATVQAVWVGIPHPSYDENDPNPNPGESGYWILRGLNSSGDPATGFSLTLTLPHYEEENPTICRWDGVAWDCGRDGFNDTVVWRHNVTAFSDWAVGEYVPPVLTYIYLPVVTR